MLNDVNTSKIQYFAIIGSAVFIFFIIELVRKKKIKEEYSLLWLFLGGIFLIFSIWRNGLEIISRYLGIAYAPAAFLLMLIMAIFLILIQFSIVISKLSLNNKDLTQKLGLLEMELVKLKEGIKNKEPDNK